jgi:hypothetical protein
VKAYGDSDNIISEMTAKNFVRCTSPTCDLHNITCAVKEFSPASLRTDLERSQPYKIWRHGVNCIYRFFSPNPKPSDDRVRDQHMTRFGEGRTTGRMWPLFVSSFVRVNYILVGYEYALIAEHLGLSTGWFPRTWGWGAHYLGDYEYGLLIAHIMWKDTRKHKGDMHALVRQLARASHGLYGPKAAEQFLHNA